MSSHTLEPLAAATLAAPGLSVAIGWDPPLDTYFAVLHRDGADIAEEDMVILWIGTSYGEIHDVRTVVDAVTPYAVITDALAPILIAERTREGSHPRAP